MHGRGEDGDAFARVQFWLDEAPPTGRTVVCMSYVPKPPWGIRYQEIVEKLGRSFIYAYLYDHHVIGRNEMLEQVRDLCLL